MDMATYLPHDLEGGLKILSLLVGAWVVVYVSKRFSPVVRLRIVPRRLNDGAIILRLEAENVSRVRVRQQKCLLKVIEHPPNPQQDISEWITFEQGDLPENERSSPWQPSLPVLGTRTRIYPGECIQVERVHVLQHKDALLQVGFQFIAKHRVKWLLRGVLQYGERWTITQFIDPKALAVRSEVPERSPGRGVPEE